MLKWLVLALLLVAQPALADIAISNKSTAGAQATASAAAITGVSYRACKVTATVAADATGVTGITTLNVRDGATGAGTVVWTIVLSTSASSTAGVQTPNLNIVGSPGTAMTVEFAAGAANSGVETVNLTLGRGLPCDP
jgi:hypothetical protein